MVTSATEETRKVGRPSKGPQVKGMAVVKVFNNAGKNPTFMMPVSLIRNLELTAGDSVLVTWDEEKVSIKKVENE